MRSVDRVVRERVSSSRRTVKRKTHHPCLVVVSHGLVFLVKYRLRFLCDWLARAFSMESGLLIAKRVTFAPIGLYCQSIESISGLLAYVVCLILSPANACKLAVTLSTVETAFGTL
jgi:hypothetical protein